MTTSNGTLDELDENGIGRMSLQEKQVFYLLCDQYVQSVKANAPTDDK